MIDVPRQNIETVYAMFFIMGSKTETHDAPLLGWLFLLTIDALQVLRVLATPNYGWSLQTAMFVRWADPMYVLQIMSNLLFPRWFVYMVNSIFVVLLIGLALYALSSMSLGESKKSTAFIAIVYLSQYGVHVAFVSIVGWIMMPMECHYTYVETPFSNFIHNDPNWGCTPWINPDLIVTILSLAMLVTFIPWSLCFAYYGFSTSLFLEHPLSAYTGEVTYNYTVMRVVILIIPYFSQYITTIAASAIVSILFFNLSNKQKKVLPYHNHTVNLYRGGLFSAFTHLCTSSILVSIIKYATGTEATGTASQMLEWVLLCTVPLIVFMGVLGVHFYREGLYYNLNRIRTEYILKQKMDKDGGDDASEVCGGSQAVPQFPIMPRMKSAYDAFYLTLPPGSQAFINGQHGLSSALALLHRRREKDQPFLCYIVARALEEAPFFQNLQIFQLLMLRYATRDYVASASLMKTLKQDRSLRSDRAYVLYSLERKAGTETQGIGASGGQANAMSMIEFNNSMDRARKFHLQYYTKQKFFWQILTKKTTDRQEVSMETLNQLIDLILQCDRARHKAKQDYISLTDRYPSSVTLLRNHASFCDTVLNDVSRAEKLRKQAAAIEDDTHGVEEDAEIQIQLELGAQTSTGTGASDVQENGRLITLRFIQNNRHTVLAAEFSKLRRLNLVIRQAIAFLVIVGVATFCTTDFFLFRDSVMKNLRLIDGTGLFTVYSMRACYYLRSQAIAAARGDDDEVSRLRDRIQEFALRLQEQHWSNYQDIPDALSYFYHLDPLTHVDPVGNSWKFYNHSFWYLGNEYVSRLDAASSTTPAEWRDPNYRIGDLSPEKRNVPYVFENSLRYLIPSFYRVLAMYEDQVFAFGVFVQILVAGSCIINALLILFIIVIILKSFRDFVQQLYHPCICATLALYMPRATCKKLYKFFQEQETEMNIMDDEDLMMRNIQKDLDAMTAQNQQNAQGDASGSPRLGDDEEDACQHEGGDGEMIVPFSEENLSAHTHRMSLMSDLPGKYGTDDGWDFVVVTKANSAQDDDDDDDLALANPRKRAPIRLINTRDRNPKGGGEGDSDSEKDVPLGKKGPRGPGGGGQYKALPQKEFPTRSRVTKSSSMRAHANQSPISALVTSSEKKLPKVHGILKGSIDLDPQGGGGGKGGGSQRPAPQSYRIPSGA